MFIPYRTDAPVYHFPFATIGVIAANIAVFTLMARDTEPFLPYVLEWGAGWKPWQWITGHFLHDGILHLVGNLLFLWVFGLVVEGKLGPGRFLAVYFGIAAVEGAVEQTIFLVADGGGSVGASSVIYGLLAMSWIWAPKNAVHALLFFPPFVRSFRWTIQTFAWLYIGMDLGTAILLGSGGVVSGELLHILGAAIGLPVAIGMLRKGWVDCEGWDWFSVRKGAHLRGPYVGSPAVRRADPDLLDLDEDGGAELALGQIRESIAEGNGLQALALYRESAGAGRWLLAEPELRKIALLLAREGEWEDAVPILEEHCRRFPGTDPLVPLRWAEHLVVRASRPTKAKEILASIDPGRLSPAAAVHREKLQRLCQARIDAGALELFD